MSNMLFMGTECGSCLSNVYICMFLPALGLAQELPVSQVPSRAWAWYVGLRVLIFVDAYALWGCRWSS